jgi:hypothetical protein
MAFMPLELFDNLLYETHTPEEWMQQERDQKGVRPVFGVELDLVAQHIA